jgi:glycerophosphoryl diester phosphodiesterase
MAHRGSTLLWPENTMMAFQGAVDLGYKYLETDVHPSSDGALMCFHDPILDRTTDGTGPVSARSLAELATLDAGYRFDPIHHFPARATGVSIPSFEELAMTFPDAILTVDLKAARIEQLMVDTIRRLKLADRVIIGSFQEKRVRTFRRLAGKGVATSAGPRETARIVFGAKAGRAMRVTADVLQVPEFHRGINVVNERFIDVVQSQGKQVHVWTVNDPEEMTRFLDLGVDGLVTDRPDLLKGLLAARLDAWGAEEAD